MVKYTPLTLAQKNQIIALRFMAESRHTYDKISKILNIPKSTVANFCKRYEERGTAENAHGGGQKFKITLREEKKLHRTIQKDAAGRRMTLSEMTANFELTDLCQNPLSIVQFAALDLLVV
jgi:transposase